MTARSIVAMAITALVVTILQVWTVPLLGEEPPSPGDSALAFRSENTSDPDEARMVKDVKRITLRDANAFHQRFISTCMPQIPDNLYLQYCGVIATDSGRLNQRVENRDPKGILGLHWEVVGDAVLFRFWISIQRTNRTVSACNVGAKRLFVNIAFVDGNRSIGANLPELGNKSIRNVLRRLETPVMVSVGTKDQQVGSREALWRALLTALPDKYRQIDVYAENEALTCVLFRSAGRTLLFSLESNEVQIIQHQKVVPQVNRITYADGLFSLWYNGRVELEVGSREG